MANYNLTTLNSSTYGTTRIVSLANSSFTQVISNTIDNSIIRINSLIVCNDSTSALSALSLYNTGGYYISYNMTIPAKSNVSILSRDTSIYLQYNETLSLVSQSNYNYTLGNSIIITYDQIY